MAQHFLLSAAARTLSLRSIYKDGEDAAERADAFLLTRGKVKFERPDGSIGGSPGSGVTLWAAGLRAVEALERAEKQLGLVFQRLS